MSESNRVPVTNQASYSSESGEFRNREDHAHVHLGTEHTKDNEGKTRTKRKFHNLTRRDDSMNEPLDDERRDRRRGLVSSSTPSSLYECTTSSRSKQICGECRGLNLDVLIRTKNDSNHYPKRYAVPWESNNYAPWPMARVGLRYRQQKSACALCRALAAFRTTLGTDSSTEGTEPAGDGDVIMTGPYYASMLRRGSTLVRMRALRLFLVPEAILGDYRVLSDHTNHTRRGGSLVLVDNSVDFELFDPQPISPSFNANLVGSWLKYCTRYHRLLCHAGAVSVRGVQVIDCTTLQIKDYDASTPYVTLSYVWGNSKANCGPVETIGQHKTLPQLLPLVIKDAIEVTKALGYQYLWVDKFCIDQDAADLKHDQIKQMDAIYANSQLTIIGAAGQDESYGLPGVGARNRTQQCIAELDGATVIWNPLDPHESISQSHWSTRGWTFQEATLSRRRLVFTEDQVYFQCNTMNCFESNYCPLDKLHVKNKSKTLEAIRAGFFGQNRQHGYGKLVRDKESLNESFNRYLTNVEEYTSRNLRFEEDSLNAFQGIIKQFSRERHAFNHVWGLAYPSNSTEGLDCFVQSLTWTHRAAVKARRRNGFPSWAWAGWEGHIEYRLPSTQKRWFDNGLHDVKFRTIADGWLVLEELGEDSSHIVLTIAATVISLTPNAYQGAEKADTPWRILNCDARLSWSGSDHNGAELAEMLKETSRWQFAYIGSILKTSFVMILELCSNGVTWRRMGMFKVDSYSSKFAGHKISTFELE